MLRTAFSDPSRVPRAGTYISPSIGEDVLHSSPLPFPSHSQQSSMPSRSQMAHKSPNQRRPPIRSKSQHSTVRRSVRKLVSSNITPFYFQLPKPTTYLSLMAAPRLDDFTVLRCLGDGSSGEVYLVRENDTSGLYALKVIPKRKLSGTLLAIETVMAERNLLLDLRGNDFILQIRACFHDSRNYYLVTVRE